MKIAFIGTHGVGKTTLCFELAAALKRRDLAVDLVKEVARNCPLPINRQTTVAAQTWILHQQVCREIEAEADDGCAVCDRAVIDNYAYLVHAAGRQSAWEPFLREWLETYTLLVKVPVVGPPVFDGTRDTSEEFQRDVDTLIDELLAAFAVPRLDLAGEPRERWTDAVLAALDERP
jgi:nicotinamide riboside kinase